jgi:hypothetical protein
MRFNLLLFVLVVSATFAASSWPFDLPRYYEPTAPVDAYENLHRKISPETVKVNTNDGVWRSAPHNFGATYHKRQTEDGQESLVEFPIKGLFGSEEHWKELYDNLIHAEHNKEEYARLKDDALMSCDNDEKSDFFKMAPIFSGTLTLENPTLSYSAKCFKDTTVTLNVVNKNTIEVIHKLKAGKSLLCTDSYFYSTLTNFHVEVFARHGTHKVTFKLTDEQYEVFEAVGISLFRVCDKSIHFVPDLFKSLWLFIGGLGLNPNIPFFGSKPTPFMEKQNVKFLGEAMNYTWQVRPKDVVVELDESLINSGDFLAIIRFDGLDPIIGYGSGSHVGHCTMAIRIDGELYVAESQSGWYWPRTGIQLNPYKQWVKWARNAGFHVTWLPLKPEIQAKWDNDAAVKFFRTIEGVPYGYHNFLWGWLDTAAHSYPPLLSPELLAPVMSIIEKLVPSASTSVFTESLNMRLGTKGLNIAQIAIEAASRNLTIPDLYAMVEKDGWVYSDGVSYVCSSFVVAMYKAAGLFEGLDINAVEFTPRDLYQLNFFDPNPPVPANCKAVDPTNPFCQIMGKWRMEFPGLGTVSMYQNMNEHCWSEGPEYARYPQGC